MALIKLTALTHPEFSKNGPAPVYVDASRVLLIVRGTHQFVKMGSEQLKREAYDDMWSGIQRLTKLMSEKMPTEIDTQEAAKWAREIHQVSHDVNHCYAAWGRSYRFEDQYPRVECTEVQLACGTALEHGVMLTRIMVTETPEEVAKLIDGQWADPRSAMNGLPA